MRISVDDPVSNIRYIRVYLNGVREKYVQTADTKEGWIEAFKVNEDGVAELRANKDDPNLMEPVLERRYGKVELKLEED